MYKMIGKGKKNLILDFWISICVRNIVIYVKSFVYKYCE